MSLQCKCDNCKFRCGEAASMDYPYPTEWCSKGHWDGAGEIGEEYNPVWDNCEDFKLHEI